MTQPRVRLLILKVASRCNLACSYCYVYFKGDHSWRDRPVFMSERTFSQTLTWMRSQAIGSAGLPVTLLFHGGEPMLVGPERFDAMCREATSTRGIHVASLAIQTNGVLIDDDWIDVFLRHSVSVGVSIDGPMRVHDEHRYDHQGRGSHARVLSGIRKLQAADIRSTLLSVINLDHDPLEVHHHLLRDVRAASVDYLLPDHTHDTIPAIRDRYGPTPVADWLIPIFDDWWKHDSISVRVPIFDAIIASLLGMTYSVQFGNLPFGYLVVESDGSVESLDVLKICQPSVPKTGVTVYSADPLFASLPDFHRRAVFDGIPLPTLCRDCREVATCGGGWLPHRFSRDRGFDNPSAWCADLLKLFDHVRLILGITESRMSPLEVGEGHT